MGKSETGPWDFTAIAGHLYGTWWCAATGYKLSIKTLQVGGMFRETSTP